MHPPSDTAVPVAIPFGREEFDLPPVAGPTRSYVIASTPRSGSTLLCDLLLATGRLGVPTEYFNNKDAVKATAERLGLPHPPPIDGYLREVRRRRTSANGVFGTKLHFHQAAERLPHPVFRRFLAESRFVWLRRRDLLAQSISLALAWQTDRWFVPADGAAAAEPPKDEPPISYTSLTRAMSLIQGENAYWGFFFQANRIEPLLIDYEAMLDRPAAAVSAVLTLVGESPEHEVRLDKARFGRQADQRNARVRAEIMNNLRVRPRSPAAPAPAEG